MTEQSFTVPIQGGARLEPAEPILPMARYEYAKCPIRACPWTYAHQPPGDYPIWPDDFPGKTGAAVILGAHYADVDRHITAHLAQHSHTEIFREMRGLLETCIDLRNQIGRIQHEPMRLMTSPASNIVITSNATLADVDEA